MIRAARIGPLFFVSFPMIRLTLIIAMLAAILLAVSADARLRDTGFRRQPQKHTVFQPPIPQHHTKHNRERHRVSWCINDFTLSMSRCRKK